jgi:hypothetical protein
MPSTGLLFALDDSNVRGLGVSVDRERKVMLTYARVITVKAVLRGRGEHEMAKRRTQNGNCKCM